MICKQSSIYKSGIDKSDISEMLTEWEDITDEFTINNSNFKIGYGKILKNEALKEIKISIRIDLKNIVTISQYDILKYDDILLHNYNLEDGISSLNSAYIDNNNKLNPRGFCMMWTENNTINVQISNPSNQTHLTGFIIEAIVVYH